MVVAFYISGHGFGHASRSIQVINELGRLRPETRILVRTAVPRSFFDGAVHVPIQLTPVETDTGVVQVDSLRLDEEQTARRAAAFYADFERRASDEAQVLHEARASVVVADIPPLPCTAAARTGIPAVALGNFTWDWIYEGYDTFERWAPGVVQVITGAYATCALALRLPLHGGFEAFATRVVDLPFIARHSRLGRQATRERLGLPQEDLVILGSFGGHSVEVPYERVARALPFTVVVTDQEMPGAAAAPRLRRFSRAELHQLGCRYEDMVGAADVVVGKPGYGIVSECVAHDVPLLYTDRGHFREYGLFVAQMPEILRCRFISQHDLLAGRWRDAIEALLRQPLPSRRPSTDGAERAAAEITALADTAHV